MLEEKDLTDRKYTISLQKIYVFLIPQLGQERTDIFLIMMP